MLKEIQKRPTRSGSLYIPPRISDIVIEKSEKYVKTDSVIFLKERGVLRYLIMGGEIQEARKMVSEKFPDIYEYNINVAAYLDALEFFDIISKGDLEKAILFSTTNLNRHIQ